MSTKIYRDTNDKNIFLFVFMKKKVICIFKALKLNKPEAKIFVLI